MKELKYRGEFGGNDQEQTCASESNPPHEGKAISSNSQRKDHQRTSCKSERLKWLLWKASSELSHVAGSNVANPYPYNPSHRASNAFRHTTCHFDASRQQRGGFGEGKVNPSSDKAYGALRRPSTQPTLTLECGYWPWSCKLFSNWSRTWTGRNVNLRELDFGVDIAIGRYWNATNDYKCYQMPYSLHPPSTHLPTHCNIAIHFSVLRPIVTDKL